MDRRWGSFAAALLAGSFAGACGAGSDAPTDAAPALDAAAAADASLVGDASAIDASPGSCSAACGLVERCAAVDVGLDDDCDGTVDEGCTCAPGTAQACFKGDPALLAADGCVPGTQVCTAAGAWGPCEGGTHATDDCAAEDPTGCHAVSSSPYVSVDLSTGLGTFGDDATTELWTVTCPMGVTPCPAATGPNFQPLSSGEYTVEYEKTTASGLQSCTYPLYVGAPGLRVELTWEWQAGLGTDTVDLDLHMHEPGTTGAWGGDAGNEQVCAWDNCRASHFAAGGGPQWFSGASPPEPVSWYLDPVAENNTCYFTPRGNGAEWQSIAMGCHNPRLDLDNISCEPTVTDPQSSTYCNAENANIDYPPMGKWTRLGVHYFSNHSQSYDVHPRVDIYCDGRLAAALGPSGYDSPVVFAPADGATAFWLVADVLFAEDVCGNVRCVVEPLYRDTGERTPFVSDVTSVKASIGPPYPAVP